MVLLPFNILASCFKFQRYPYEYLTLHCFQPVHDCSEKTPVRLGLLEDSLYPTKLSRILISFCVLTQALTAFLTFPADFEVTTKLIVLIYQIWETSRNKLKKHSVTKNCSDLPLFEYLNCFSDLKNFANSRPSASNFKSFSQSLEHFFLTVGQNNFGNKTPFPTYILHETRFQSWVSRLAQWIQ